MEGCILANISAMLIRMAAEEREEGGRGKGDR